MLKNIGSVVIYSHRIRCQEGRMAVTTCLFLDPCWRTTQKMPFCADLLALKSQSVACNIPISFPLQCPFQLRGQRASKTGPTQRFLPLRKDLMTHQPGSKSMGVVLYRRLCQYGSSLGEHKPFALLLHRLPR